MARDPAALQLRLLQTVVEVAAERNSTLVMPIPVELLRFFDKFSPGGGQGGDQRSAADSASMADFGDAAVAAAEKEAEIGGAAVDPLEIPEVPSIPELSPAQKGDIGATEPATTVPAADSPATGSPAAEPPAAEPPTTENEKPGHSA